MLRSRVVRAGAKHRGESHCYVQLYEIFRFYPRHLETFKEKNVDNRQIQKPYSRNPIEIVVLSQ